MKTLYDELTEENQSIMNDAANWKTKAALQGNFNWGSLTVTDALSVVSALEPNKPFCIHLLSGFFNYTNLT